MQVKLNREQQTAVNHKGGPLLIIAGAGTGKTEVVTQRIVNIMKEGWAKPQEILALTFMEKASLEMEERIDKAMHLGYEEPLIATFHSFCDRILRQEAFFLGIDSDYKLINDSEAFVLFKKNLFNLPLEEYRPLNQPTKHIDQILKYFSRLQDEDISPEEYIRYAKKQKSSGELELAKTYKEFSHLKLKEGCLTFADLHTMVLRLFREKPQILEKYQKKFKYVLVDEYQDTNCIQNVLVNTLLLGKDFNSASKKQKKTVNITVVGDDDQAIYKFRGAAISNILEFKEIFPDAKSVVLTKNYRSNQEILDSAYALIKNNDPYRLEVTEKIDKRLVSQIKQDKNAVKLIPTSDILEESDAIALEILKLTGEKEDLIEISHQVFDAKGQSSLFGNDYSNKYSYSDISVLARTNSHLDEIIPVFRYYKIPYKFSSKKGLYSRSEVRFFISFLRTVADYRDNVSFLNVLQLGVWDFTPRDFIEIFSGSKRSKVSAFELVESLLGIRVGSGKANRKLNLTKKVFSKKALLSLEKLMRVYEQAFKLVKEGKLASEIVYLFLESTGYLKSLEGIGAEGDFKIENISKFFKLSRQFEQNNRGANFYDYIDYLEHSIEIGQTPSMDEDVFADYDAVNLSTVHRAKGLEFPVVFLPGLAKGRFPSVNRKEPLSVPRELTKEKFPDEGDEDSNIQEERRLFYVAATRAKEKLFLTAAQYYGEGKRRYKPSVFLNEILEREDLEEFNLVSKKGSFLVLKDGEEDKTNYSAIVPNLGSTISYSKINDYEACPKRYKYKYVLEVPVDVGFPAEFGSIIHATLKDFYTIHKAALEGLEGIVSKPTVEDLITLYEKHWREDSFQNKSHAVKKKKSGRDMLERFFDNIYTGKEEIVDLEKWFKVSVDGVLISGAVDRIDRIDSKTVVLFDYKTGRSKEQKDVEKDIQLMMYGLFAKEALGAENITASLLFLDEGIRRDTEITAKKLGFVREKVLKTADDIKNSRFEAKPGWGCRYCDYNKICDDASL